MSYRSLDVDGQEWQFKIGQTSANIKDPDGRGTTVSLSDLTGLTPHLIERGRWKKTQDGMVTPGHVRAYIEAHLRGKQ